MNAVASSFRVWALASLLVAACGCSSSQSAESATAPAKPMDLRSTGTWLERPWQMRYYMLVTQSWVSKREVATEKRNENPSASSLSVAAAVEPSAEIRLPDPPTSRTDRLSIVTIGFDEQGRVTTPHSNRAPLRGRLDTLLRVLLSEGEASSAPQYRLGEWFLGIGDVSTDWAPGLCDIRGMPSPFSKTDTRYLYGPKFEIDKYSTTFGCREWAYQLYDPDRPYIDVTSYIPKAKDKDGPGTYIREFIGWARFDDMKPVIGKHEQQWYCLHDCPGGTKPGAISDIKAWAAGSGWPVPKPPTRAPTFPDPPAVSGTYPR